ncbi:MAG TPA: trypsin-like peptidase domain-containing protein [Fimbriimonadaceae bacterium]|nr:trypsin-like peptidase domain-containing protein [Fimbriimonadaceae bacterium]
MPDHRPTLRIHGLECTFEGLAARERPPARFEFVFKKVIRRATDLGIVENVSKSRPSWLLMAGLALAVFVGVLAALRTSHWLDRNGTEELMPLLRLEDGMEVQENGSVAAPADFRAAVEKVLPAVVSVDRLSRMYDFFDDEVRIAPSGSGSGVVISSDGYIVTNNHVVRGGDTIAVRFKDGRTLVAEIVGADPRSDLALLKVEAKDLTAARVGDSSKLRIGEWAIAFGNPLGYSHTVSVGVISSLNRTMETPGGVLVDAIQTDAAINQGNSGGPLTNAQGEVIGINSVIVSNSGGSIGLGFSIPSNRVARVVNDLRKHGRVRYGYFGAETYSDSAVLQNDRNRAVLKGELGVDPPREGLLVRSVYRDSPAQSAGIQRWDVIQQLNGKPVRSTMDLYLVLLDLRAGDVLKVRLWSKGAAKTLDVRLVEAL